MTEEKENLKGMEKLAEFNRRHRRNRRIGFGITLVSLCLVFTVLFTMMRPAFGEQSVKLAYAGALETALTDSDVVRVHVSAKAGDSGIYYIADTTGTLVWEGDDTFAESQMGDPYSVITTDNGRSIQLYRYTDMAGRSGYYFSTPDSDVSFDFNFVKPAASDEKALQGENGDAASNAAIETGENAEENTENTKNTEETQSEENAGTRSETASEENAASEAGEGASEDTEETTGTETESQSTAPEENAAAEESAPSEPSVTEEAAAPEETAPAETAPAETEQTAAEETTGAEAEEAAPVNPHPYTADTARPLNVYIKAVHAQDPASASMAINGSSEDAASLEISNGYYVPQAEEPSENAQSEGTAKEEKNLFEQALDAITGNTDSVNESENAGSETAGSESISSEAAIYETPENSETAASDVTASPESIGTVSILDPETVVSPEAVEVISGGAVEVVSQSAIEDIASGNAIIVDPVIARAISESAINASESAISSGSAIASDTAIIVSPSAVEIPSQAGIVLTGIYVDTDMKPIEGIDPEPFVSLNTTDLTLSPKVIEDYGYIGARINAASASAINFTDGKYSFTDAEGNENAIESDAIVYYIYEKKETVKAETEDGITRKAVDLSVSVVDEFGTEINEGRYSISDLSFDKDGVLKLSDKSPVGKVRKEGSDKNFEYTGASINGAKIVSLKKQKLSEIASISAVSVSGIEADIVSPAAVDADFDVFSYSTDGESFVEIKNDATLVLSFTDGTKTEYDYEDDSVKVVAKLQKAGAVPSDAALKVTPVTKASTGYNYDAYMAALNENADRIAANQGKEEKIEYTEDNTLLYDIAFIVEKTDDNGNVIEGEYTEVQPEEGSVKISIEFKDKKLTDDLSASKAEDVSVVHLPLVQEIKDVIDTTADAQNITTSAIIVEPVNSEAKVAGDTEATDSAISTDVSEDTLDFTLDNFSVTAVTTSRYGVAKGDYMWDASEFDYYTSLTMGMNDDNSKDATHYGIIAQSFTQHGHTETTFMTEYFDYGNADFGLSCTGTYTSDGGYFYIGKFADGSNKLEYSGGSRTKALAYVLSPDAYKQYEKFQTKTLRGVPVVVHDPAIKVYDEIIKPIGDYYQRYFDGYDNGSDRKVDNGKATIGHNKYDGGEGGRLLTKESNNSGYVNIDFSKIKNPSNTYVTNFYGWETPVPVNDEDGFSFNFTNNNQYVIVNVHPQNDSGHEINTFKINKDYVNGKRADHFYSQELDIGELLDDLQHGTEAVILNFGSFGGTIEVAQVFAGTIIAPNATVKVTNACGRIVAKKVESFGEYHYHDYHLQRNLFTNDSVQFKAQKLLDGDAKKAVDYQISKNKGFIFNIKRWNGIKWVDSVDKETDIQTGIATFDDYQIDESDENKKYISGNSDNEKMYFKITEKVPNVKDDGILKYDTKAYLIKVTFGKSKSSSTDGNVTTTTTTYKISSIKYKELPEDTDDYTFGYDSLKDDDNSKDQTIKDYSKEGDNYSIQFDNTSRQEAGNLSIKISKNLNGSEISKGGDDDKKFKFHYEVWYPGITKWSNSFKNNSVNNDGSDVTFDLDMEGITSKPTGKTAYRFISDKGWVVLRIIEDNAPKGYQKDDHVILAAFKLDSKNAVEVEPIYFRLDKDEAAGLDPYNANGVAAFNPEAGDVNAFVGNKLKDRMGKDIVLNNSTTKEVSITKKWAGSNASPKTAYFYIKGVVNNNTSFDASRIVKIDVSDYKDGEKTYTLPVTLPEYAYSRKGVFGKVTYSVYELDGPVPDGYENGDPGNIKKSGEIANGCIVTIDTDDKGNKIITNTRNFVLPETGGGGTEKYAMFGSGALLLAASSAIAGLTKKKKESDKEDHDKE